MFDSPSLNMKRLYWKYEQKSRKIINKNSNRAAPTCCHRECRNSTKTVRAWPEFQIKLICPPPSLHQHLSAGLQLRLQAIQNRVNHQCLQAQTSGAPPFALRKWLQCTQFKMAQVEIQSSEAASQFYPMWPGSSRSQNLHATNSPWLNPVTKMKNSINWCCAGFILRRKECFVVAPFNTCTANLCYFKVTTVRLVIIGWVNVFCASGRWLWILVNNCTMLGCKKPMLLLYDVSVSLTLCYFLGCLVSSWI